MTPSLASRLVTLLLAVLAPWLLFGPAVAAGAVLAPGDGLGYYMPVRAMAAVAWGMGELPFWNPWNFGGMPLLAAIQTGAFYPGNLPFVFLPPGPAMTLTVLLAYMVAAGATWAYARAIALPPIAALLAALVFTGSGYMVAHLEHLTMLQAASLIPALFWAVERFFATARTRYAIGFALLLALQIFAGYPQTTVATAMMLAPYALWRAAMLGFKPGCRFAIALIFAALLGLGLTAVQVAPTAELLAASPRGTVRYADLIDHSWPVREVVTLLFPYLYGVTPGELFRVPAWGAGPWRNELMGYVGVGTLMLAALGLAAARTLGLARFWAAVAIVAGALALGGQTPLYKLWAAVPGLKIMRVPGRHLLELDFALALLAGLGLAWLLALKPAQRQRATAWGSGLVAVPMVLVAAAAAVGRFSVAPRWQPFAPPGVDVLAALAPSQPAVWVPLVALALTALALWRLGRSGGPVAAGLLVAVVAADLGLVGAHQGWRQLVPQPGPDLVFNRPTLGDQPRTLALSATGYPFGDARRTLSLRYPQTGALAGAKLVNGYEPIVPARYAQLVGRMAMGGTVSEAQVLTLAHHALDLMQGRWVRLDPGVYAKPAWSDPIEAHPRWERQPDEAGTVVFTNHRALPRAWRPAVVLGRSVRQINDALRNDVAFEPRTTALLEGGVAKAPAWTPGEAWARTLSPNRIKVKTTGTGPGLVVVSEAYDQGWRAFEGPIEAPVLRVDGLVLGVPVGSGTRELELVYEPTSFARARTISLGMGALLVLWALWAALVNGLLKGRAGWA